MNCQVENCKDNASELRIEKLLLENSKQTCTIKTPVCSCHATMIEFNEITKVTIDAL